MQSVTALAAGVWTSDPAHSTIGYAVPIVGVEHGTGVFRRHRATMAVAETGAVEGFAFELEAASVDAGDEVRDLRVTSMDFLDIENHPTISYTSSTVVDAGAVLEIEGRLVMNGLGHTVAIVATLGAPTTSPAGVSSVAMRATGHVSRAAFGLRGPLDADRRAQPDADVIRFTAELAFRHPGR